MPNAIKYTTGSETLALKKGNFYIGTGDVGKGPSDTTGYYNGVSPSSGGYVIYMNKTGAPGNLSYHNAPTDEAFISFTNNLAGQSYTGVNQCLVYYAGQTDKVCVNIDYPAISTNSLVLNLDTGFAPSYPQSGTTWYDISGNNLNGTLTNGPTYSGGSIVFDGSDDFVSLGNQQSLQFTDSFSAFIWVKPTSQQFQKGIIGNATYNNGGWMIALSNNFFKPIIVINSQTEQAVLGNTTLSLNAWYNIGFTFSSGVLTLYLNGLVDNTGSGLSITKNTTTFVIGKGSQGGWGSFTGLIPSSQVYNRVLTLSEVLQNYQSMFPRFLGENIVTNGLIFYVDAGYRTSYPESGTTFYDVSGYGNNGTLVNGVGFNSSNGGSFIFDGTDDNGYTNSNINLLPLGDNPRTMSYWIYPTKTTSQTLIQIAGYGVDNGVGNLFAGSIGSNGKSFLWANSNNYTSSHNITLNTWQQITWVKTAGNIVCYKNGVADNGGSYTINTLASRPYMGQVFNQNIYDKYQGNIGNFIIYNRALSDSEVLQNFNAQKSRFGL